MVWCCGWLLGACSAGVGVLGATVVCAVAAGHLWVGPRGGRLAYGWLVSDGLAWVALRGGLPWPFRRRGFVPHGVGVCLVPWGGCVVIGVELDLERVGVRLGVKPPWGWMATVFLGVEWLRGVVVVVAVVVRMGHPGLRGPGPLDVGEPVRGLRSRHPLRGRGRSPDGLAGVV